ncbi:hypothetical protein SH528x_003666 [Novipirellula sp. SH528]|uniref:hypothetical protein n=1 Tax=Novipirellula sp. SH528 TaxID=3454466 RepID=UPI003FA16941
MAATIPNADFQLRCFTKATIETENEKIDVSKPANKVVARKETEPHWTSTVLDITSSQIIGGPSSAIIDIASPVADNDSFSGTPMRVERCSGATPEGRYGDERLGFMMLIKISRPLD